MSNHQKSVTLFVPGRLCLSGEHSDWAATYRARTPSISPGTALVVGLQQGLHATATPTPTTLTLSSDLAGPLTLPPTLLLAHALSPSPWRFAAAVAHIIHERYNKTGLTLHITSSTLPAGKGLSSSAAVCVLAARAFNLLHALQLTRAGEMDVAYAAERVTGSACGRMDQVVAIGPGRVARMYFDGEHVAHRVVTVEGPPLYVVLADLGAVKDTKAILAGLHSAFQGGDRGRELRDALGEANLTLVEHMESAVVRGDARDLGRLFCVAQEKFDKAAMPFCPEQLTSPLLHAMLSDPDVLPHVYGGKGVGSQGDGAVQFVAIDHRNALTLKKILKQKLGTEPIIVKIGDGDVREGHNSNSLPIPSPLTERSRIHTAVIPAAGFGTRLFPASRSIRPKALFPIVDADGFAKPLMLYLVEQCAAAGISRVIIVVGPGEQEDRVREIFSPVPEDLYKALKPHMRKYAERIAQLSSLIEISVQHEPKGFGHAVACANLEEDCPFALLLGDVVFKSFQSGESCLKQTIDAFESDPSKSVIGVTQVPVAEASAYGVVRTAKEGWGSRTRVPIQEIVEKPDCAKAEELSRGGKCNIVLGPYVFTPMLMKELVKDVKADRKQGGEIQLTSAMVTVLENEGMDSLRLEGEALDTGNAAEYMRTIASLCV